MTSIREFQNMMARIYLSRDSKRGTIGTYNWLREEVDELADVIAWLASLANILDIDLEKAMLRKYDNCCPRCRSSPCKCQFKY